MTWWKTPEVMWCSCARAQGTDLLFLRLPSFQVSLLTQNEPWWSCFPILASSQEPWPWLPDLGSFRIKVSNKSPLGSMLFNLFRKDKCGPSTFQSPNLQRPMSRQNVLFVSMNAELSSLGHKRGQKALFYSSRPEFGMDELETKAGTGGSREGNHISQLHKYWKINVPPPLCL